MKRKREEEKSPSPQELVFDSIIILTIAKHIEEWDDLSNFLVFLEKRNKRGPLFRYEDSFNYLLDCLSPYDWLFHARWTP